MIYTCILVFMLNRGVATSQVHYSTMDQCQVHKNEFIKHWNEGNKSTGNAGYVYGDCIESVNN